MAGDLLPILVVAGNYRQFCHWCQENKISPNSPLVKYVSEWHKIRGRRGNPYVLTGTYWEHRDIHEIYHALRYIEAVEMPRRGEIEWPRRLFAREAPASPTSTPTSSPSS